MLIPRQIDLAEAARLAGSNTTNAMRERVRRARVHFEELSTAVGGASEGGGASSTSAGSGSKKRPSLSKPSARPAKKAAISVDKDLVVTAKSVESDDVDDLV